MSDLLKYRLWTVWALGALSGCAAPQTQSVSSQLMSPVPVTATVPASPASLLPPATTPAASWLAVPDAQTVASAVPPAVVPPVHKSPVALAKPKHGQPRQPALPDEPAQPASPVTPAPAAPASSPSAAAARPDAATSANPASATRAKQNAQTSAASAPLDAPLPPILQRRPEQIPLELQAPAKYHHPVREAKELTMMLGEDKAGYYLYAEGPIQKGTYAKFLKYVDFYQQQNRALHRLMMHSNGGLMDEGLQIGEYLHQHGWTTDLDSHMRCYSSCAFIYMGGVKKRFQAGAELGFHRPYLPDVPDSAQIIAGVYRTYSPYWQQVGGSQQLYDEFMMHYGRDDLLMLTDKTVGKYVSVTKY